MLDKVLILNKNEAVLIFTNRTPITLSSDENVVLLVMWYLEHPQVFSAPDGSIEFRRDTSEEITQKIMLDGVA
jgi:hypothetical protein